MAIVIEAKLPALPGIARLTNALGRATDQAAKLNATLASVAANAQSAANSIAGVQMPRSSGPSQASSRQNALNGANPRTFGNRSLGASRYSGRKPPIIRPQQNGFDQVLSRAILRTRFSVGKAQILGTDIMQLLGGAGGRGGAAGGAGGLGSMVSRFLPFFAAVKGAEAGINTFIAGIRSATATLIEWKAGLVGGGGTVGQAVSAQAVGKALGVDIAGVGRGLGSGTAAAFAAQAGINPFGGPFGDNDYNKKGLQAADYVRRSKSFNEARRRAEGLGDPNLANSYFLNDQNYNALRNQPGANVGAMADAANLVASMQRIADDWKHIIVDLMAPPLKGVAAAANWLAGVMDNLRDWIARLMKRLGFDVGNKDVRDNTRALNANTQAQREGTFGGGERANSATPSKWHPVFGGNPTPMGVI